MIHPFRFLWKQFNGPQITAFCTAIYDYMVQRFDTRLDYFNNLNISTATSGHLTLMGLYAGLTRPIMKVQNEKYFWFTDGGPIEGYSYGFADSDNLSSGGGVFGDIDTGSEEHAELLPTELYRKLLSDYVQNDAERGSLVLLDNFLYTLWTTYRSDIPDYYIRIADNADGNNSYGDIWIYLGSESGWGDSLPYVDAIIDSLSTYVYTPEPRLFVSYTTYEE